MNTVNRKHHAAYQLNYHLVLLPKYRKKGLQSPISDLLSEIILKICSIYEFRLISSKIRPDHVHLFLSAPPKFAPSTIAKIVKSITARQIFRDYPELKQDVFWGGHFWSNGYYIGSAGAVSSTTIQEFIEWQDHI